MLLQDYQDFFPEKSNILYLKHSFIETQFKYCPLVCMFHGRQTNHKINRFHERAIRIVYNEYVPSFQDLPNKDNSLTIHHQNIKSLPIEIFKTSNNLQE